MGLTLEELIKHSEIIINSRRIKDKIVILCEGEGGVWNLKGRPSPQSYGKMEQMPDAYFYSACVPKWWTQYRPQFFNCGDRKDVLDTYFQVLELHYEDTPKSYLNPKKLFAIVDLDLQVQKIDNYDFADTDEIFFNLYKESKVNKNNASQHRIWVTGLIHKEAYFLTPELQSVFDNFPNHPYYQENILKLLDIYTDMVDAICNDLDLQKHLQKSHARVSYCHGLDCTDVYKLCKSWKAQFNYTQDEARKTQLIIALLILKKAKFFWNQIKPSNDWTSSEQNFREQLSLAIARFYSEYNCDDSHLPIFFKTLYEFI